MARKIEVKNWLMEHDVDQLNWVKEYLRLKCHPNFGFIPVDYKRLLLKLTEILSSESGDEFISKMKAKWRQEKYTKNRKVSSFVISKSAHNKLNNLCKEVKEPKNKVVEHLILGEYEKIRIEKKKEKDINKQRKSREMKQSYGLGYGVYLKKDKYILQLEDDLKKQRDKLEFIEEITDEQLKLICHLEVIIEDYNLDISNLTDEQLEKAEKMYIDRVKSQKS